MLYGAVWWLIVIFLKKDAKKFAGNKKCCIFVLPNASFGFLSYLVFVVWCLGVLVFGS